MSVLREGGVLCINIVARSAQVRNSFCERLQRVGERRGGRLLTVRASEDTVNVVAVVLKGEAASAPVGQVRTYPVTRAPLPLLMSCDVSVSANRPGTWSRCCALGDRCVMVLRQGGMP